MRSQADPLRTIQNFQYDCLIFVKLHILTIIRMNYFITGILCNVRNPKASVKGEENDFLNFLPLIKFTACSELDLSKNSDRCAYWHAFKLKISLFLCAQTLAHISLGKFVFL